MPAQTRSLVYSRAARNVQQFHQKGGQLLSIGMYTPYSVQARSLLAWAGEVCAVPGTEIES